MRICEVGRYSRMDQRMDFEQVEHVGAVSLDTWYAALAGLDVVNFLCYVAVARSWFTVLTKWLILRRLHSPTQLQYCGGYLYMRFEDIFMIKVLGATLIQPIAGRYECNQ